MLSRKQVDKCQQNANEVIEYWKDNFGGLDKEALAGELEVLDLCDTVRELRELLEEARELAMREEEHGLQNRFFRALQ